MANARQRVQCWCLFLLIDVVHALVAPPSSTLIVGGGPAGLATAIALSRRGYKNIEVLDRLAPPAALDDTATWGDTARFYLIGIGGRGQKALRKIGAWEAIEPFTQEVAGRKDWSPGAGVDGGVLTIRADRPPSNVIQRDRLVACLLHLATETYGVRVRHEVDVTDVRWEGGHAIVSCSPCGDESCQLDEGEGSTRDVQPGEKFDLAAPFLIACDGARRTVGEAVEREDAQRKWVLPGRRFRIKRFEDTSVRVYKTGAPPSALPSLLSSPNHPRSEPFVCVRARGSAVQAAGRLARRYQLLGQARAVRAVT